MGALRVGSEFDTESHGKVRVVGHLGSGGQGDVFKVDTDVGPKALKWYYPSMATAEQRAIIRHVVAAQLGDTRLLWPEALVSGDASFGYIMPIRPPQFVTLSRIIKGRTDVDIRALLRAAIGLVGAYRAIQVAGLAYRDIKDPNVFVDPATGEVLICDNDNAVADSSPSQIKGTMDFCAPELLTSGAQPNNLADLHSLSVLLFMLLVRGHPLDGLRESQIHCLNDNARLRLYGTDPLFVFDPNDDSNRPAPGRHDRVVRYWQIWPEDLRAVWTACFTAGLRDPARRPTLQQWMAALGRAHDSLRTCASCSKTTVAPKNSAEAWRCWNCGAPVSPGWRLRVHDRVIMLEPGVGVFSHHLENRSTAADFTEAAFTVTANPKDPSAIGLRNDTDSPVTYVRSDGSAAAIEPGRSALVADGAELVTPSATLKFRR